MLVSVCIACSIAEQILHEPIYPVWSEPGAMLKIIDLHSEWMHESGTIHHRQDNGTDDSEITNKITYEILELLNSTNIPEDQIQPDLQSRPAEKLNLKLLVI